ARPRRTRPLRPEAQRRRSRSGQTRWLLLPGYIGVEHAKGAPGTSALFACGSAEDVFGGVTESIVDPGDQSDHEDDEDDHGGRVRRELVAGRPDHLAEFRDDLPVEEREAPQRTLL